MESKGRDEFDGLLDDALGLYGAEPRAGIEARILHRVRIEGGSKKRFPWLWFAMPIPALLLLVIVFRTHQSTPPKKPVQSVANYAPVSTVPALVNVTVAKGKRPKHFRRALPHSAQFPTPSPLTPEERALVQFVSRYPEATREIASKQNAPEQAPIEIPELQIPLLSESGGQ